MSRYALYFAPEPDSHWWQAGCHWLGRNAATGQALPPTKVNGLTTERFHQLTQDARRYGFHATLKAPFRLQAGYNFSALDLALRAFCARQSALPVASPQLVWLGQFLAVCAGGDVAPLQTLAQQCVSEFDHFRAAPTPSEIEKRLRQPLTPRQTELMQHWGYPYTEEEFRFHMTLTAPVTDTQERAALMQAAQAALPFDTALVIDRISVFYEPEPGADFQLRRQYLFGA